MVDAYNDRASKQGLFPAEMSATVGDLLSLVEPAPPLLDPEYFDFDLAVVGLGMHHFEDPQLAVKRLVERIRLGSGTLLVIDFLEFGPVSTGTTESTIAHHGFAREQMVRIMEQGGCEDVDFVVLGEGTVLAGDGTREPRSVFMCRGRRCEIAA
ncbi:MAG: hypothetical protein M1815_003309 [Lichina confinis]|nr:MAG: hypothetical protein M1815_003309 [Lichina confinis]